MADHPADRPIAAPANQNISPATMLEAELAHQRDIARLILGDEEFEAIEREIDGAAPRSAP